MLIRCPECGKRISDKVEACPHCGAPQPASLRIAAAEQRRVAWRKAIRITATVVIVALLASATTFSFIYRWPISYEVGTVNGTDVVSREELLKIVDEAAATWNRAAGRTVAWHLPLGRKVEIDVEIDASLQQYLTRLGDLRREEQAYRSAEAIAAAHVEAALANQFSSIVPLGGTTSYLDDLRLEEHAALVRLADVINRIDAYKKSALYTEEPYDLDAGVHRTDGSPTTVVLAWLPDTYTLSAVVIHQFGHLLLGTWGANDSPSNVTAAPLKSPWKLHLFGATSQ
jgi:hypothetical protein